MDELNIGVTVDASNAVDGMTKVKASIDEVNASAQRMAVSQDQAARMIARTEAESRRFLAALKEEAESYGKSREELMAYRASQLGVANEAQAFIDRIKEMKAANLAGGAEDAAKGMDHLNFSTAGARRELLVLAHEASQGNWTRFGGSLMVLGERTDAMSLIFSRAGLVIGATAASVGTLVVALIKGANESKAFGDTMQVTGGIAALTEGRFNEMASILAMKTNTSIGTARQALQELVATGQFSGDQMLMIGQAAVRMSSLTGQSTEDIVKDFAKMTDGVAKWAAEHNRSMHFMTSDTYALVVALEEQGKKTEAIALVSKAFYEQMKEDTTRVGYLETAWHGVGQALSSVWDTMKSIGRDKTTEQVIKGLQDQLKVAQAAHDTKLSTQFQQQIAAEEEKLRYQRVVAEAKASLDIRNQHAIEAQDYIKHLREEVDETDRVTKKIQEYRKNAAYLAGTKQAISPEQQAKDEAEIRKKFAPQAVHVDNTFQDRLRSLQDEGLKLDSQIEQWQKYGKAMDQSRAVIMEWNVAHDRILAKLPEEKKAQLIAQARLDDEKAEKLAGIESIKTLEDKIKAVQAEASVQTASKEATRQALLMKELDSIAVRISKEDYDRLAKAIRESTAALEAKNAIDAIKAQEGKTADQIKRIQEEAQLIGKSTLERQKLVEQLKIEAEARKEIAKYPDQQAAIQASAAKQIADVNAALDEAHAKLVAFDTGAQSAFKDYADSAANSAEQAHKLFTDAFSGMEDALVEFVTKGKLDFTKLADSIVADITRIIIKQQLSNALGVAGGAGGGGGLIGSIGNFFEGTQAPAPLVDVIPKLLSGGKASGGIVDRNSLYQVNENGPELLNYGGKDYLMMGGTSGYVTPVGSSGSGSGASSRPIIVSPTINVQGSVDARSRSQIATETGLAVQRALARNS